MPSAHALALRARPHALRVCARPRPPRSRTPRPPRLHTPMPSAHIHALHVNPRTIRARARAPFAHTPIPSALAPTSPSQHFFLHFTHTRHAAYNHVDTPRPAPAPSPAQQTPARFALVCVSFAYPPPPSGTPAYASRTPSPCAIVHANPTRTSTPAQPHQRAPSPAGIPHSPFQPAASRSRTLAYASSPTLAGALRLNIQEHAHGSTRAHANRRPVHAPRRPTPALPHDVPLQRPPLRLTVHARPLRRSMRASPHKRSHSARSHGSRTPAHAPGPHNTRAPNDWNALMRVPGPFAYPLRRHPPAACQRASRRGACALRECVPPSGDAHAARMRVSPRHPTAYQRVPIPGHVAPPSPPCASPAFVCARVGAFVRTPDACRRSAVARPRASSHPSRWVGSCFLEYN
ncbi:hypothetical protein PLICRDRAFT_180517 [Plicaturopsis crispa FD-325 SS-3]|uniref:Uncharacterized protein n=1 Tax=Plicaturopsis crispa FD-325 SS-3 TaxID=944288 RepID=A0A0C9T587_PLICR|nr:hypothetical protein PLICRDRAFT_180517 [Plicaturopsis crispa FD-325 SS-3]